MALTLQNYAVSLEKRPNHFLSEDRQKVFTRTYAGGCAYVRVSRLVCMRKFVPTYVPKVLVLSEKDKFIFKKDKDLFKKRTCVFYPLAD